MLGVSQLPTAQAFDEIQELAPPGAPLPYHRAVRSATAVLVAMVMAVACSGGSSESRPAATTGFPAPDVTAPRTVASRSVLEPDSVAGIPLGASKDQAAAVLGPATTTTSERDSAGSYQTLRWQLSGSRGLALSFRAGSRFSPGLTDWKTDIRGPATSAGIEVGSQMEAVVAAYGPLADFCCATKIASVERGGGRLVVMVLTSTGVTDRIVGGDPKAWIRTIEE
jgi:hypothetical protein